MVISIKNLLGESLARTGATKEVGAAMICDEFDKLVLKIMGDKFKDRVQAKYVKDGAMTVAVLSSATGQEVKMNEHELLEELGKKIGSIKVKKIRILM